ncbi:hypothetical protein HCC36_10920 [Listeria booriae]|uniref:YopX protein domain-containing protein n=1 Tax=Listeria booriae TaxID=1552123 RepID=A0A842GAB8_9LIST|nr:YopX family protein [Listeria booriae]MBC2293740.1 hypothetical protein [Listeria booriae]
MNNLEFRGLSRTGEWVFGDLIQFFNPAVSFIVKRKNGPSTLSYFQIVPVMMCEIDPKTAGRFTGVRESHDSKKKIYEHDIVHVLNDEFDFTGVVIFSEGTWLVVNSELENAEQLWDEISIIKHVGNIFDDKELADRYFKGWDYYADEV